MGNATLITTFILIVLGIMVVFFWIRSTKKKSNFGMER
jgi:preprotein translocase subunit YajC